MMASEEPECRPATDFPEDVPQSRYLLRKVLWCGLCDLPLVPVLGLPSVRYHACQNKRCPRPLALAEVMEQRVWSRFVLLNEVFAHGVPRDRRQAVLREVLKRVVVGETTVDLCFEWRD
jgi:hypothetical protein